MGQEKFGIEDRPRANRWRNGPRTMLMMLAKGGSILSIVGSPFPFFDEAGRQTKKPDCSDCSSTTVYYSDIF